MRSSNCGLCNLGQTSVRYFWAKSTCMVSAHNDSAEKRDKEPASQVPRELLCPFVPLVKYWRWLIINFSKFSIGLCLKNEIYIYINYEILCRFKAHQNYCFEFFAQNIDSTRSHQFLNENGREGGYILFIFRPSIKAPMGLKPSYPSSNAKEQNCWKYGASSIW